VCNTQIWVARQGCPLPQGLSLALPAAWDIVSHPPPWTRDPSNASPSRDSQVRGCLNVLKLSGEYEEGVGSLNGWVERAGDRE
jgi:hypothetical protein